MVVGDLRLELTPAEAKTGVVAAGDVPEYTVREVELMLEYKDLASDAARMVNQSNSGGYMISFDSFANFASSLEIRTAGMHVLNPARYSSLKTLFTVVRETTKIVTHTTASSSGRTNLFGDTGQWYYPIGRKKIPSTRVKKTRRMRQSYAKPCMRSALRATPLSCPDPHGPPARMAHTSSLPISSRSRTSRSCPKAG